MKHNSHQEIAMGLDGKKHHVNKLAVALAEAEGIPYSEALQRVENYPGEPEQIEHPRGRNDSEIPRNALSKVKETCPHGVIGGRCDYCEGAPAEGENQ